MNSILVGMFDSQASADAARSRLLSAGFMAEHVSTANGAVDASTETARETESLTGTISHFFSKLFADGDADPTDRNKYSPTYSEAFRRGQYAVSVTATSESEIDKAEEILNDAGALDIDEQAAHWRKEGWNAEPTSASAAPDMAPQTLAAAASGGTEAMNEGTQKLQEISEELKVGKRAVARGGVRIFSRMTEVPVSETVQLREERADIRRTSVDRPATESDLQAFKEGVIEVRESGEEAVVSKTARVVGEVEVSKRVTEREELVQDTVRKSTVEVEPLAAGSDGTRAAVASTSNTLLTESPEASLSGDKSPLID